MCIRDRAFAVLACAFVLFSEKEFDRLFKPEGEGEASLDDLLGDELPGMRPVSYTHLRSRLRPAAAPTRVS